jgi:hypothetical protein
MESCGRACFIGANGERKSVPPTNEEVAGFLKAMKDRFGDDSVRQDGNDTLIYFRYTQNPKGLKVSQGYCLCPLVEDGPARLSDTYCQCSVGYVRELFERSTDRPAEVVLMESLRRGGKACRFTVRVKGLSVVS